MTEFEKHITESAREYSLSSDEKARMKRVILDYAKHKPIREAYTVSTVSYSWISILYRPVAAALVLVLVTGSGVSYAAETALPGDVLYGVKTGLNEPVRVALATDAEAKAEVQMELAERRIEEATTLAVEGRLDATTEDELAAAFESHAAAASESIMAADESDATTSSELATRFENRLAAHEMVLAEVGFELDSAESAEIPQVHRLADAIRITNATLAEARFERSPVAVAYDVAANAALMASDTSAAVEADPAAMTMSLATSEPVAEVTLEARSAKMAVAPAPEPVAAPDARTIARMERAAERSLKNVETTLRKAKALSTEAKARAEADIELATTMLDDGRSLLTADADADAYASFQESLRISEQAFVFMKAAPALEKARTRNSRNHRNDDSDSHKGGIDAAIDISIPATAVDATVTIPVQVRPDHEDKPTSDDGDTTEPEDEENAPEPQESKGLIKSIINLNISL